MFEKRNLSPLVTNNSASLPENFKVFVFQPNEAFFSLPFDERLAAFTERLALAKKSLPQSTNKSPAPKKSCLPWNKLKNKATTEKQAPPQALFVAPEYLFKNFSEWCYRRYFTQAQKKIFIETLTQLSTDTDMLIAPGTLCWYKKSKEDGLNYYRNTSYFFHRGKVKKYKKKYPHSNYDFDYSDEGFLNHMDHRRMYFKSGEFDPSVHDYAGMKLGVEICYDSVKGALAHYIDQHKMPLTIQLIIADGAKEPTYVAQEGILLLKIEKNPTETQIGRIHLKESGQIVLKSADLIESLLEKELTCFKFN